VFDWNRSPEEKKRRRMISTLRGRGIRDERVLRAMETIPRDIFPPPESAPKPTVTALFPSERAKPFPSPTSSPG
jgi:protein-L-isoaspartate O-methyltransferase